MYMHIINYNFILITHSLFEIFNFSTTVYTKAYLMSRVSTFFDVNFIRQDNNSIYNYN